MVSLDKMRKENDRLVEENKNLRTKEIEEGNSRRIPVMIMTQPRNPLAKKLKQVLVIENL